MLHVDDVRWLNEREERAWRSLQFMQMRLEGELARQLAADSGLSYPGLPRARRADRPPRRSDAAVRARPACSAGRRAALSHHVGRMADRGTWSRRRSATPTGAAPTSSSPGAGRREIEAAAPGHVAAVRRLFVDRLTPSQLDAIGDAADIVLATFDEPVAPDVEPIAQR